MSVVYFGGTFFPNQRRGGEVGHPFAGGRCLLVGTDQSSALLRATFGAISVCDERPPNCQ